MPPWEKYGQKDQPAGPWSKYSGLTEEMVDKKSGAPASVRAVVGSVNDPGDRLANLRRYYPDAQPYKDDNFVFADPKSERPTLYNPPGFDAGDIASVGGEMAEVGGGAIGGALATPPALAAAIPTGGASLLGIPAAYGAGAAAGRSLLDTSLNLGGRIDTRGLGRTLLDSGVTAGTNAVGYRAGDLIGQAGRAMFGPVARRMFPGNAVQDAQTIGVDIPAGVATGNRAMQVVDTGLANTPGGASTYQRLGERAVDQMSDAAGRVARFFGTPQTPQGAGATIREGAGAAGERFATRRYQLDDNIEQLIGADTLVPVRNVTALRTELEGQLARAPQSRAGELNGAINRLRALEGDAQQGGVAFGALRSIRTSLGRELDRPDVAGYTAAEEAALRRAYGAIREDIRGAADAAGPDARRALDVHDRYVRYNRTNNLPTLQKIADAGTDEQAFNIAMNAAKDGGTTLMRLRRNLTNDEWGTVASSVFARLGRAKPGQQGASEIGQLADDFSPATFLTNWSALAPESRQALFGGTRYANIVPELNALTRTVARFKDADKMANPSGTARNAIAALAVMGAGKDIFEGDTTGAALTIGGAVLAPRVAAQLLTSPRFINWLGQTVNAQGSNWTARIGRLAAIAEAEPAIQDEIDQYMSALRSTTAPSGELSSGQTGKAPARR